MYYYNFLLSFTLLINFILLVRCGEGEEAKLEIHNILKPHECPRKAKPGDVVTVHYTGTLLNGKVFDSSYERNAEFPFQIGIGKVIKAWDQGLLGTCAGEKLRLVVPPHLGYGEADLNSIPAHSTIVFEIHVIKIEDGPPVVNVFKEIDTNGDKMISRKEMIDYVKLQQQHAQEHGDTGSPDDPDQMDMVEEIFMHEDKDKDDMISYEEFMGPKHDQHHDEL